MRIIYQGFMYESQDVEKMTLDELYPEGIPENELLNNYVSPSDMNIPFTIRTLEVSELKKLTNNGELVTTLFTKYADKDQKDIVKYYIKLTGEMTRDPIVISGSQLLDGFHRTIAAIKTNTPMKCIDLDEPV